MRRQRRRKIFKFGPPLDPPLDAPLPSLSLSLPIVVPFLSKTSPSFSLSGKLEGGLLVIDNTQENRGDAPAGDEGGIREDPERPGQTHRGRLKGGAGGGGEKRQAPSIVHPSIHRDCGGARIHAEKYKITTLRRRAG